MCQENIQQKKAFLKPQNEQELYIRLSKKQQHLSEFLLKHLIETSLQTPQLRSKEASNSIKELKRIIGGVPVFDGEFNECCLIGSRNMYGIINWSCTGVLVHPRIVLTAAHCIEAGSAYVVALSANIRDDSRAELINVRKATVHPDYFHTNKFNDIAVIVLQSEATTAPVSIGTSQAINTAEEVEIVGFGDDNILATRGFGVKRMVEVDIVSLRRDVNEDLNNDEALYGYESDLEFVAGGKGFDACDGDSGGPVYIITNEQRVVIGLTSRAIINSINRCGDGGIYTRLDVHVSFINNFINNL